MNLELIKENLLKTASSFSKNGGKDLVKSSSVKDLKSTSIDEVYHIYGRVLNDNKSKTFSTHIKINKNNNKVIDTKCTCETFEENRKHIRNYSCKHIVATTYMFYNVAKSKIKKVHKEYESQVIKKKEDIKRFLSLDLIIKCVMESGMRSYQVQFKVGNGNSTYLITDLKEFIEARNNKGKIIFNEVFTYNSIKDDFIEQDVRIIDFIDKSRTNIKGRSLIINENNLRVFLELLDSNKRIVFNYESINYESKVVKGNMPVAFTVLTRKDEIILRHHKKFPTLLNYHGDVLFYDRKIYIPRKRQIESYLPLYKNLIKNSEISYPKGKKVLKDLLGELKKITNNIILDETTKILSSDLTKSYFYIYKNKENIFCNVKLDYCGYIIDLIKDKDNKSFLRDYKKEESIYRELERFRFIKRDNDFMFIGNEEELFDLLSKGLLSLNKIGLVKLSDDFKEFKVLNCLNINSSIDEDNNFYKLSYGIEDFNQEDFRYAIKAMKNGERFYKTKNSYLDLEDTGVVEFLNFIDDLGVDNSFNNEITVDKNKVLYLQEKLKNRNLSFIKGGNILQEIVQKLLKREYKRKYVPKGLNATLRDYQVTGFKWINEITSLGFGCILADDMGLGKTIQIITFILSQKKKKTLIVTPTAVLYNWKEEFEKFAESLKIGVVHGSKNSRDKVLDNYKKYDVLLTTYGTLKNDEERYNDLNFDYCIIDEAQNIKNPKSQATVSVKKIKSKCNIALTGTPIENNLMELWSIFDFIMPGYLFTKDRFRERFIINDSIEELKTLISPFILRRLKEEVLNELPDKIEKKYFVDLPLKQKQVYKTYVKKIKEDIDNSNSEVNLLGSLTRLRELCLDPSLIIPDYIGDSGKIKVVKNLVKEYVESGNKILLFSQFTSVLKKIEEEFIENDIKYLYLDGGTSAKERVELVSKFNEDSSSKVFLISLKAGGVGLNLTSANIVIHFDPWWNPAIEDQATDRAHRFGQKNIVEVVKLIAKDTVEEKIVKLQEDKRELIESLMDGKVMDGERFKKLTDEEILKLFE